MIAIAARIAVIVVAVAGLVAVGIVALRSDGRSVAGSPGAAPETVAAQDTPPATWTPPVAPGGFGEAGHMVRYEMPEAEVMPPLPEGTADLSWADLWADGTLEVAAEGDRIGNPDSSQFPEGSTAEDVMNFFLDLGDMRSLQPQEGAIRAELDGRRVRLAGYTTPVGFAEDETRFLLVPELGACIHVPPPPANQIVYVEKTAGTPEMFAAVWVTGTLRAAPVATILADVGYRLEDVTTEPYR